MGRQTRVRVWLLFWICLFMPVIARAEQVATPTFSPGGGTYSAPQKVTLSCATPGATIRYTYEASDPTPASQIYSHGVPITVLGNVTIKARAFRTGMSDSAVATATYKMVVDAPKFNPGTGTYLLPQKVTLVSGTPGAIIRYTYDASDPTPASQIYNDGVPIPVLGNITIKARAFRFGMTDSSVASATYHMVADAPDFSPGSGTYSIPQKVTLVSGTPGVTIRYTMDGSDPTQYSQLYDGVPIPVMGNITLKARAFRLGMTDSSVTSETYKMVVNAPKFSPGAGTYSSPQKVTLVSGTPEVTIRYTMNGSEPTQSSQLYEGVPISVFGNLTLKARAFRPGMTDSSVTTAEYVIVKTP